MAAETERRRTRVARKVYKYRDADDDSVELWPPSSVDVVVAVGLADVVEVEVDIVSASGVESRKPAGGRWAGVLS